MISTDSTEELTVVSEVSPAPFFSVSLLKLTVMSFCTLGFYELYWFYQNWKLIRDREDETISPFWRSFFAVLFCHKLFLNVRDYGDEHDTSTSLQAGALAAGWIIVTITWRLPDPYSLISFFAVFFLLPVQAHINQINQSCAPDQEVNDKFSLLNWVTIVLGALLLLVLVLSELYPVEPG